MGIIEIIGGIVLSVIGLQHNDTIQFVASLLTVLNGLALMYLAMGAKTAFRNEQTVKKQEAKIRELERKLSGESQEKGSASDSNKDLQGSAPETMSSFSASVASAAINASVCITKQKEYRTLLGKSIVIGAGTIGRLLMHTGNNKALVEFVLEDQTIHKVSCSYDELEIVSEIPR